MNEYCCFNEDPFCLFQPKSVDVDVGGASGSIEPSLSHSLTDVSKQSPKSITGSKNLFMVRAPKIILTASDRELSQ